MKLIHFKTIDSTNKYLKDNYKNLENFTFVSADFQSGGRGRENRNWLSNDKENLLFSYLLKDKNIIDKYKAISLGTATLVARFLQLHGLKNVLVKWPNDVYVNDKKICGILLEGSLPNYLVVGVGINVNQKDFIGEYRIPPTSMFLETGKIYDIALLKDELFKFLEKHINQKMFNEKTLEFLRKNNYLENKKVTINGVSGIVTGFNEVFSILIDNVPVTSGEIELLFN